MNSAGSSLAAGSTDPRGTIEVSRYRLLMAAQGEPSLPAYSGSAWRGALGHALRRLVCVTRMQACATCLLYHGCPYPYLFETPPPPGSARLRRYPHAPHPFVLEPAEDALRPAPAEGPYPLGLVVVGRAHRYLPYLIAALERAGRDGVGVRRTPYVLGPVEREERIGAGVFHRVGEGLGAMERCAPQTLDADAPPEGEVDIEILTPLRVVRDGALVGADALRFADLFGSVLRRCSSLAYFHCDAELALPFRELTEAARGVHWDPDLAWREWTRYSSRQGTRVRMGGVIGRARLPGSSLTPFWPLLRLGEVVHAGKGAVMGLGRYRLRPASPGAGQP